MKYQKLKCFFGYEYRQALRDITNTYPAPATDNDDLLIGIVWHIKP